MDVKTYMEQFEANFSKLKHNREMVPLEDLQTKYAKAYDSLVEWLEQYVEWFAEFTIKSQAPPEYPTDDAGNAWLRDKITEIKAEEKSPGGIYHKMREALIDNLDRAAFEKEAQRLYERLRAEAYDPYQQRFNVWSGPPDDRWIYNHLFEAWWLFNPNSDEGGNWIGMDCQVKNIKGYPPNIGPDPQSSKK